MRPCATGIAPHTASRLPFRAGRQPYGAFLRQPQKQDISNCSARLLPTCLNASLRSSDKPLKSTAARQNEAVRNITVFSNGAQNTPPHLQRRQTAGGRTRRREGKTGNQTSLPSPSPTPPAGPGGEGGRDEGLRNWQAEVK